MNKISYLFLFLSLILIPIKVLYDKEEISKTKLETTADSVEVKFSTWQLAEASFYDPNDDNQTREGCTGVGSFGRPIESGSIALGSSFTKGLQEEKAIVFIQIDHLDVMTPYGKAIFRVDDNMNKKYRKKNKTFLDFNQQDLDSKHKNMGRFILKFRVYKVIQTSSNL